MKRAKMAIQCVAKNGETGTFLYSGKDADGNRLEVSPIFCGVAELCDWMKLNGWSAESKSLLTEYVKKPTIAEQIKRGMALAFFASAYADQADECEQPLSGEIMDQIPDDIDPAAIHAAETLARDLIRANWRPEIAERPELTVEKGLTLIYKKAGELSADGADRELSPELFGHYCAMDAMGTGVGLESFGYAVNDFFKVPYCEFGSYSLERDYFQSADGSDEK